jgi:hypothetical protein
MTVAAIFVLCAISVYLGKRWSETRLENAQLRDQVATLKRQLARLRR